MMEEIAATAGGPSRFANKFDTITSAKKLGEQM
jgi:hypothetical protein